MTLSSTVALSWEHRTLAVSIPTYLLLSPDVVSNKKRLGGYLMLRGKPVHCPAALCPICHGPFWLCVLLNSRCLPGCVHGLQIPPYSYAYVFQMLPIITLAGPLAPVQFLALKPQSLCWELSLPGFDPFFLCEPFSTRPTVLGLTFLA